MDRPLLARRHSGLADCVRHGYRAFHPRLAASSLAGGGQSRRRRLVAFAFREQMGLRFVHNVRRIDRGGPDSDRHPLFPETIIDTRCVYRYPLRNRAVGFDIAALPGQSSSARALHCQRRTAGYLAFLATPRGIYRLLHALEASEGNIRHPLSHYAAPGRSASLSFDRHQSWAARTARIETQAVDLPFYK